MSASSARYDKLGLRFNPFFQGHLYYDDPYFDKLFLDIDGRAETISKMILSYRDVANPLRLQVVGGKGYGKSTLLNAVVRRIVRESGSKSTKLLPVYCSVSESMYKSEPQELSDLFYMKIWEEVSILSESTTESFRKRILARASGTTSKDVAEAVASAAVAFYNPLLSAAIPIAREALEAAWKKAKKANDKLPSKSSHGLPTLIESFIEDASEKNMKPIFLIDELDKADSKVLLSFFAAERRFFESQNRIIVLATSGGIAEQFEYAGGTVREIHREFEQLVGIDRLPNLTESSEIIYNRLRWASASSKEKSGTSSSSSKFNPSEVMPRDIVERIHYVSGAIPSAMMQVSFETIENAVKKGARRVAIEHLPSFVEEMKNIEHVLAKFGVVHKELLKISLEGKEINASDLEIQKKVKVTRSRLSQILGELSERGILISSREGKYRNYKIAEAWKGGIEQLLKLDQKALD
ncbi:MAG: helix-turn-helix transcriptional regulator [Nitrososphaerota archaeon]|nr:helix-turn-helix transcriptional regulator [Nitrososphaerota archaeon]